jgi:hypothetical protein
LLLLQAEIHGIVERRVNFHPTRLFDERLGLLFPYFFKLAWAPLLGLLALELLEAYLFLWPELVKLLVAGSLRVRHQLVDRGPFGLLLVLFDQLVGLAHTVTCHLLKELLDVSEVALEVVLSHGEVVLRVLGSQFVLEMLLEVRVLLEHAELDDVVDEVLRVDEAQQLLRLYANLLKVLQNELSGLLNLLAPDVIGEDERLEEEPDSVGEEDAGLGGHQDEVDEIVGVVHIALNVDAAELGDVELQVHPDV